jgi:membrane protein implicated in regulation of membrane protease activity
METKSKLAFLKLIAGLFGWIWIGASIAALYFLAIVMFYGGTWTQFFWALGTSIVAKWLARSFDDNKKRVAFEARLKTSDIQNVSKPDE